MRDVREWDEDYLLSSLPVGEHSWLEGKGSLLLDVSRQGVDRSKGLNTLSKAVSAMANSGGGVLILGMIEHKTGWEIDNGGIVLSFEQRGRITTREWLGNIIPNLVDGPLKDFNVYVITRKSVDSQIAVDCGVFVIEIGDSEQAPHQARDNIYYARSGSNSVAIGHRFVVDIFSRRQHPKMELEIDTFQVVRRYEGSSNPLFGAMVRSSMFYSPEEESMLKAHFRVKNIGRVFANYVICFVAIPRSLIHDHTDTSEVDLIDGIEYVEWAKENTRRDLIRLDGLRQEYGPSRYEPILPSLSFTWDWELGQSSQMNS